MPLFRNSLTVQGLLTANSGIRVGNRYSISSSGGMDWAPASGVNDVNFYRAATGLLQTDYTINAGALQIGGVDVAGTIAPAGTVRATDQSLAGWTYAPREVQGGTVQPTAGLAQVARIRVLSSTVTNIHFYVTSGGSSLTSGQCFAALYNDAGALLGAGAVTASAHGTGAAGWGDAGLKTMPLSVGQAVTPYAWYRVLWWFNGTTGPTLARAANTAAASLNAGQSAPTLQFSTADTGLTTAAPANIGSQTGQATAWWVGLS
jgi:hypothetical protein